MAEKTKRPPMVQFREQAVVIAAMDYAEETTPFRKKVLLIAVRRYREALKIRREQGGGFDG